jgi:hypothetical protein
MQNESAFGEQDLISFAALKALKGRSLKLVITALV